MLSRRSRPIQLSSTARRRRPAAGFTLTEVLVVIGVIAVLVGIVMVGVTYVTRSSNVSATKVTLGNLQSMVAELEANAGTNRQPPFLYHGTMTREDFSAAAPFDGWKDGDVSSPTTFEPLPNPGLVTAEADPTKANWKKTAVANTQIMVATLGSIPRNRSVLSQLPAETQAKIDATFFGTTPDFKEENTPIILDSWGNPIVFVPTYGMDLIYFEAHQGTDNVFPSADDEEHIITSQGPLEPTATDVPAGSRPFWASAGPDGDFRTGDDNVYSFEN